MVTDFLLLGKWDTILFRVYEWNYWLVVNFGLRWYKFIRERFLIFRNIFYLPNSRILFFILQWLAESVISNKCVFAGGVVSNKFEGFLELYCCPLRDTSKFIELLNCTNVSIQGNWYFLENFTLLTSQLFHRRFFTFSHLWYFWICLQRDVDILFNNFHHCIATFGSIKLIDIQQPWNT